MNNIGVVNSQLEEQCCSHEKCNESEQCANQSLKFPMEIIHCIYDYKKFEESCIINKDIYDYVKKKECDAFYNHCNDCEDSFCGHKSTIIFCWNTVIGYSIDDETGCRDKVFGSKEIKMCKTCFTIGLLLFHYTHKMIPYLRNDGNIYSNIIKNLRDKLAPEKYLYLVANQEFQKIKETKFENFVSSNGYEYYICDYYNQQKYKDKLTESFYPLSKMLQT